MKKVPGYLTAFLIIISFNACTTNNNTAKDDINDLSAYVDSVNNLTPVYTESQWAMINDGYKTRANKTDKIVIDLDEAEKTKLKSSKEKYENLKIKYRAGIKDANDGVRVKQDIRDALLGAGKYSGGNWDFVTPANIVSIYEDFVKTVREKGDNYSDAQWAEEKALWKGLNERKDEIDKDLSAKDKTKIVGLRIAHGAIKSVNRPVSDIKEEVKAN